MQSQAILKQARDLIDRPTETTVGLWPRAAALLARQALELAMLEAWALLGLELGACSQRSQLLCLGEVLRDPSLGQGVNHAWWALTQSCHHQTYQLSPTDRELRNWLATVDRLISTIGQRLQSRKTE